MWAWALVDKGGGHLLTFNWAGALPSASVNGRCWIRVVWWGSHSKWAWALVDGGGGALFTFNQAGGLLCAFINGCCRLRVVVGRP